MAFIGNFISVPVVSQYETAEEDETEFWDTSLSCFWADVQNYDLMSIHVVMASGMTHASTHVTAGCGQSAEGSSWCLACCLVQKLRGPGGVSSNQARLSEPWVMNVVVQTPLAQRLLKCELQGLLHSCCRTPLPQSWQHRRLLMVFRVRSLRIWMNSQLTAQNCLLLNLAKITAYIYLENEPK